MIYMIFICILILSMLLIYFFTISDKNKNIKSKILKFNDKNMLSECKKVYINFIRGIKDKNFNYVSEFCSKDLLKSIYSITDIHIPLYIGFVRVLNTIEYHDTHKEITVAFYCKSLNKSIKDICSFYVTSNQIDILSFNNIGQHK